MSGFVCCDVKSMIIHLFCSEAMQLALDRLARGCRFIAVADQVRFDIIEIPTVDEATDQGRVVRASGLFIDQGVQAIVERIGITARTRASLSPSRLALRRKRFSRVLVSVSVVMCLLSGSMPDVMRQRT